MNRAKFHHLGDNNLGLFFFSKLPLGALGDSLSVGHKE